MLIKKHKLRYLLTANTYYEKPVSSTLPNIQAQCSCTIQRTDFHTCNKFMTYGKRNKQYGRRSQKAVQQNLFTMDIHPNLRVDCIHFKMLSDSIDFRHRNTGGYSQLPDTLTAAVQNEKRDRRGWLNDI